MIQIIATDKHRIDRGLIRTLGQVRKIFRGQLNLGFPIKVGLGIDKTGLSEGFS